MFQVAGKGEGQSCEQTDGHLSMSVLRVSGSGMEMYKHVLVWKV